MGSGLAAPSPPLPWHRVRVGIAVGKHAEEYRHGRSRAPGWMKLPGWTKLLDARKASGGAERRGLVGDGFYRE